MAHDDHSPKNVAETVRDIMADAPEVSILDELNFGTLHSPYLVSVPNGRTVVDMTDKVRAAMSHMQPFRRKGTDTVHDLDSLIAWANRFAGEGSVLFADQGRETNRPSITCIADWHHKGPASIDTESGDGTARHGDHRAIYSFPTSKEWKAWTAVSGEKMDAATMGNFLEDHILNVMDPTPALTVGAGDVTEADRRLIEIAAKIGTKFGTATQLMTMSKEFVVNETSNFAISRNNTTGEGALQVVSEHRDTSGQVINVPGLFLIAIPVFDGGPAYRMPVRFQYRKSGGSVAFFLTLHDPQRALDDAFNEAVTRAAEQTAMPVFRGRPAA